MIVEEGKIFFLVGFFGGGKIILLCMLVGLEKIDLGIIVYDGKEVFVDYLEILNFLGFVF